MAFKLSDDRTRGIHDGPVFGIACYEGGVVESTSSPTGYDWDGAHVGVVGTVEEAERWLERDPAVTIQRVYPLKHAA